MKTDQLVSWPTILVLIAMALCQDPGSPWGQKDEGRRRERGIFKSEKSSFIESESKVVLKLPQQSEENGRSCKHDRDGEW